ncbi:MAG: AAA family ATPase, partial [Planctomycetes bacterium]|nr:AAA family ATPase [Planctomycetota bacterium]
AAGYAVIDDPTKEGKPRRLSAVWASEVTRKKIEWLWPNRFALGKFTVLAGMPGLGKSFLSLDMAARVSSGGYWPDLPNERIERGRVIILNLEDDPDDTICPRHNLSTTLSAES